MPMFKEYLQEINKIELLDLPQETALWCAYKEEGDLAARKTLIESYQPLVFKLAQPYQELNSIMDLVQEGLVGLIEAIEQYDHLRGVAFSTFATFRIKGRIINYLYKEGRKDLALLDEETEAGFTRAELIPAVLPAWSEELDQETKLDKIKTAMLRLPEKERAVISSVYLENQAVSSVAEEMNVSESHIYRLKQKGIKRIRGMLSKFIQSWK